MGFMLHCRILTSIVMCKPDKNKDSKALNGVFGCTEQAILTFGC